MNDDIQRFRHIENHRLENTKVFGDRFSAIHFVVPDSPRYLEIGVGDGHYSQHIVDYKNPKLMHLLDFYDRPDPIYGHYTADTHENYILNKFVNLSKMHR